MILHHVANIVYNTQLHVRRMIVMWNIAEENKLDLQLFTRLCPKILCFMTQGRTFASESANLIIEQTLPLFSVSATTHFPLNNFLSSPLVTL